MGSIRPSSWYSVHPLPQATKNSKSYRIVGIYTENLGTPALAKATKTISIRCWDEGTGAWKTSQMHGKMVQMMFFLASLCLKKLGVILSRKIWSKTLCHRLPVSEEEVQCCPGRGRTCSCDIDAIYRRRGIQDHRRKHAYWIQHHELTPNFTQQTLAEHCPPLALKYQESAVDDVQSFLACSKWHGITNAPQPIGGSVARIFIASRIAGLVLFGPESKPGNHWKPTFRSWGILFFLFPKMYKGQVWDQGYKSPHFHNLLDNAFHLHPWKRQVPAFRNSKNAISFAAAKVPRMYAISEKTLSLECYLLEKGCTGGTRQSWRKERRFPQKDRLSNDLFSNVETRIRDWKHSSLQHKMVV